MGDEKPLEVGGRKHPETLYVEIEQRLLLLVLKVYMNLKFLQKLLKKANKHLIAKPCFLHCEKGQTLQILKKDSYQK